jgi:hypothetical protein
MKYTPGSESWRRRRFAHAAIVPALLASLSHCSSDASKSPETTAGGSTASGGTGVGGANAQGGVAADGMSAAGQSGGGATSGGTLGDAGSTSTGGMGVTGGANAQGGADSTGGVSTGGTVAGSGSGMPPVAGMGGAPPSGGSSGAGGMGGAAGASAGASGGPSCPKPSGQLCHEFYATDNSLHQIIHVDEFEPSKSWTQLTQDRNGANSARQISIVENAMGTGGKALLVSVDSGYEEYDLATHQLLTRVNGLSGVRGALRLPDGNTVLGVGDARLRVVTPAGALVGAECNLPGTGTDTLRVLERDPATGHIYFGRGLDIFAVTTSCQQQWTARLPDAASKAYTVTPKAGGGAWATTGDASTVVELNAAGQVVKQVGGKAAHPNLLDFLSGFDIVESGNIVAANWWGHIATPPQGGPHLVEFNAQNQLVWRWGTQNEARQITNVLVVR